MQLKPRASESQTSIFNWLQNITQPTIENQVVKLCEEFDEFINAYESGDREGMKSEIVDIVIVCFTIGALLGISIIRRVNAKMKVNRKRKWEIQENGVTHHVN